MTHAPRRTIPGLHLLVIGFGAVAVMVLYNDRADSEKKESGTATVAGTHIEWEGWTINWSLRRQEGLVLTDVLYRGRKVLKYAGVAELFTAYDQGDPRPVDLSQNGLGEPRAPIVPGKDCSSGEWCKVLDARGHELTRGAAPMVMIHEERTGPNYLGKFGRSPGKTLVLWSPGFFNGTIDGYTFVVRWKFHEDGMLIPEIGASGVPQHLKTGDSSPTGSFIGYNEQKEKVFAPSHVHNVLYRLDLDVDGEENTVEEFNREQQKSPNEKQALSTWTPLPQETGRQSSPETYRSWRVVNSKSKNALGHPRSYQLIPGSPGVFRGDQSDNEKSTQADLWVTVNKPDEMPRSTADKRTALAALPSYANGESAENRDVVLWYWLSFHHMPRSEEWMYQPMVWKSFELMPRDFLDSSPLKPE